MHTKEALASLPAKLSSSTDATSPAGISSPAGVSSSASASVTPSSLKDPRAERTRQLIFGSVADLMRAPSPSVSVTDIVRGAGISRSSFYAHFSSLDDVTSELVRTQFAHIGITTPAGAGERSTAHGQHSARAGYTRLVEHLVMHFPLYSRVLELPLTRSTYDALVRDYSRRVVETAATPQFTSNGITAQMAATYSAAGALGLITSWMGGDFEASADEIVDELVNLLPPWLSNTSC